MDFQKLFSTETIHSLKNLEEDKDEMPGSTYDWAVTLYAEFNKNPDNKRLQQLNKDRKKCLQLVYDIVNAKGIEETQKILGNNLERILKICVPMDKAQSLYNLRLNREDLNGNVGLPWYSELHITDSAFDSFEERDDFIEYLKKYPGSRPTMNKRIYKLLTNKSIGLNKDPLFIELLKPTKVPEFNTLPEMIHFQEKTWDD
jgi:hypothetical protein